MSVSENGIDPPSSAKGPALADWIETVMLVDGIDEYPRQAILRRLSAEPAAADAEGTEVPEVAKRAAENTRVDRLLQEITLRAEQAPDVYPFTVDDGVVVRTSAVGGDCYLFMLWLSRADAPFRETAKGRASVEQPWDELARTALEVLVGPNGDSRLFAQRHGSDAATDEKRPKSFPAAIEWLREHLRLTRGHEAAIDEVDAEAEDDDELPARTYSDGGADVIAWHHFRDGRAGFPIIIAQCTIQMNWRPKTRDVSLELWRSWIDFPAPPQKMLVIPFAPTIEPRIWRDRTRQAGMLIDRLRVSELIAELDDTRLQQLSEPRSAWTNGDIGAWAEVVTHAVQDPPEAKDPK